MLVQLCELVEWYARWKLWGCGLFVWSCMPAKNFFKGDVVTLFSGSRLSLKRALGGRRAIVAEKSGDGRFSSQGLASVVKTSWTRLWNTPRVPRFCRILQEPSELEADLDIERLC